MPSDTAGLHLHGELDSAHADHRRFRQPGRSGIHDRDGAGDAWTPTILNLLGFWFWELPLAWLLAYRVGFGAAGTFMAITIAVSTLALASALLFRRGRWKLKIV